MGGGIHREIQGKRNEKFPSRYLDVPLRLKHWKSDTYLSDEQFVKEEGKEDINSTIWIVNRIEQTDHFMLKNPLTMNRLKVSGIGRDPEIHFHSQNTNQSKWHMISIPIGYISFFNVEYKGFLGKEEQENKKKEEQENKQKEGIKEKAKYKLSLHKNFSFDDYWIPQYYVSSIHKF